MTEEILPKRIRLDTEEISSLTRDDIVDRFREQEQYIRYLEKSRSRSADGAEDDDADSPEEKLKRQNVESNRRENTLVLRLTNKEQELQDCLNQISEMKQAQTQSTAQLRTMLLDPALNLVFQRMAKEVDESKEKLKQTQNELSAWKFTSDSQTGKRLMAKCRLLLQENDELGKMIASGRTAKLEGEIALQKTLVQEMKKNQEELDEFVTELEEDVEGMQSMIYMLQTQLKDTNDQLAQLQAENQQLRTKKQPVSSLGSSKLASNSVDILNSSLVETSTCGEDISIVSLKVRTPSPPVVCADLNHSRSEEEAMDTESAVLVSNRRVNIDSQPTSCDSREAFQDKTTNSENAVQSRVLSADSTSFHDQTEAYSPVNNRIGNNGAGDAGDKESSQIADKTMATMSVLSESDDTGVTSADVKPVRNGIEQVTRLEVDESSV